MTFVAMLQLNTHIFGNPFSAEVSDAPKKLQLELTKPQYDSILHSSFNQVASIAFYASLPVSRFSELCKSAKNFTCVFGSTYTCEQA
jgi:hypothetical protein